MSLFGYLGTPLNEWRNQQTFVEVLSAVAPSTARRLTGIPIHLFMPWRIRRGSLGLAQKYILIHRLYLLHEELIHPHLNGFEVRQCCEPRLRRDTGVWY